MQGPGAGPTAAALLDSVRRRRFAFALLGLFLLAWFVAVQVWGANRGSGVGRAASALAGWALAGAGIAFGVGVGLGVRIRRGMGLLRPSSSLRQETRVIVQAARDSAQRHALVAALMVFVTVASWAMALASCTGAACSVDQGVLEALLGVMAFGSLAASVAFIVLALRSRTVRLVATIEDLASEDREVQRGLGPRVQTIPRTVPHPALEEVRARRNLAWLAAFATAVALALTAGMATWRHCGQAGGCTAPPDEVDVAFAIVAWTFIAATLTMLGFAVRAHRRYHAALLNDVTTPYEG